MLLRLYTHNIRYAASRRYANELAWEARHDNVIKSIMIHAGITPNCVVALQEVLAGQLRDIMQGLGPHWGYVAASRDDGEQKGEQMVLIYQKSHWIVRKHVFWLSNTPRKPSKGWDAAYPRVLLQGHFASVADASKQFTVYCTHFDHKGSVAREESARQALRLMNDCEGLQFLVGDLNCEPDSVPYKILTSSLIDAHTHSPCHFGYECTFTGFDDSDEMRIDYILSNRLNPVHYSILHANYGYMCSDHRPVLADYQI